MAKFVSVQPTLSVCSVAGFESPAFLDLFVVSINSGTNFRLGFGAAFIASSFLIGGVSSGVGRAFAGCLLLLKVVSTGSGRNRLLGGTAKSCLSTPLAFSFSVSFSFLLLLVVVSTGSTANRRTLELFTVVSIGVGKKRLVVGGGDDSTIVPVPSCTLRFEYGAVNWAFHE